MGNTLPPLAQKENFLGFMRIRMAGLAGGHIGLFGDQELQFLQKAIYVTLFYT